MKLVQLLRQRAESAPERLAYRFLGEGEAEESRITYGELDLRARSIAAHLQESGSIGERALLLYPAGLAYVEAFFGCLYAGVIAVPAPLPRLNRNAQRLQAIIKDAEATIALTNGSFLRKVESLTTQLPELARLRWLATDSIDASPAETYLERELSAESVAYLQYTSGSTSTPKGVMVTHGNVLHNSASIHKGFGHTPDSRALTWLPHFHDMGLIDGIIQPLYGGFPATIMSPTSFLQHPLRWLEAVTRFQITHTGGPNFAYDLCVRRLNTAQLATLDLRSWRVAYNGAEPVRRETLRRFADTFRECGFREGAFYPAYGLAEATLKVSGGGGAITCTVQADALEQHRVVEAVPEQGATRTLVSCGKAGLDTEIEIINAETLRRCAVEEVGEIWVHGPGVAAGYWGRPEETEQTFHARWVENGRTSEKIYLRTGDLGFVREGELFVTGRVKDLIIIRGRNLYPHDLELVVEQCHAALRAGGGAAFSLEIAGQERLVVVQELESRQQANTASLIESIRQTLADEFEVQPYAILLVKAGSVPKTSSGKVQRSACRTMFETGSFDALAEWRAPLDFDADKSEPIEMAELSSEEVIASWIRAQLAARLKIEAGAINVDSSLTRYGVDSLIVVELMHSIETQLGVLLPMSEAVSSQSITQIAARCFELLEATHSARQIPEAGAVDESTFPLSHGQQALWFLQQLAPESTAYNIASALRIKTKPDESALRSAFQSLVERHAALRTTFSAVAGRAMQHVREEPMASLEIVDASRWDEAALGERLRDEAHLPFDLERGPLLRAILFRRADGEQVLLIVAHHIAIDFWSLAVLMRELGELYRAAANHTTPALAPHTSNYFAYVRRQQQLLAGEAGERLAAFWRQQLAGELPVLNLHTDKPRPAVQTFRGASAPLRIDAQLTVQLKALGQANDATLFITLLTAFKVLLYRYTGQEDLLVGSPTAGRHSAQFAETIGYFVNPIVLRTSPAGALSFTEFLKQVRHITLDALAHQEYPLALLVKQLQPERDPSRSPLFQAMFTLNKAHVVGAEEIGAFSLGEAGVQMNLGGLPLESMRLEQRIAQFDLSLTIVEIGDELSASLEYNTDLFDPVTIKRMLDNFQTLLESIVVTPWQRLDQLPLLNESERQLLLDEWSGAIDGELGEETAPLVHQLFEQHAEQQPDNTAVVFGGTRLSYRELNTRANKLAHYLRRRGVSTDVPVAICVERSLEMIVAVLGVLKAGGAYVPLDPRYPRERLAFMLADTRAPWLLTQQHLVAALSESSAQTLCLDENWDEIAGESETNPPRETNQVAQQSDSLAYVIYTSGSTGRPKGVMVSHRSLAAAYQSWRQPYLLDSSPCVLQMASFSFDVFTENVLRSLMSGGKLVLCPQETLLSPRDLYELMRAEKVELAEFVPALLRPLMQYLEETRQTLDFLRVVISGADALYADEYQQLRRLCSGEARVFNSYGLTEATIDNLIFESSIADVLCLESPFSFTPGFSSVSRQRVLSTGLKPGMNERQSLAELNFNGATPLGRPFAGVRVYILDPQLQPVPAGVAGELYVSGECLARGYLKRADLTAARFCPNPFAAESGARLYQTGDLARFLSGGNIEFLGRKDEQVKVRGYRIELGEIETALKQHERVRDAIVVAGTNGHGAQGVRGEKKLVAYVVAEGEHKQQPQQLREFLAASLTAHMIPSAFVFLDALPVTPNGKLDRRALPPPDFSGNHNTEATDDFPRTDAERILVRIWSELLKVESIGRHDNFFHLGGDSILSIQVVARARQSGLRLTPRQIFEHPTIAALARVAESISQAISQEGNEPERGAGNVSLTPIQRWFCEQNFSAPAHWNMSLLLEANERLELSLVESTVAHLLEHHDTLCLRFVRDDSGWRQFIAEREEARCCVRHVDLSELTGAAQRAALEATAEAAQRELELGAGRLMQVVLFDLGAGGQRLLWVVHHLVVDGVSWRILLEDFETVYRQLRSGEGVRLPSKTTSFQRWAKRLEQLAQTPEARQELDYWKATAQCANRLPVDREGVNNEGSARTFTVSLSTADTNALLQHVPEAYHTRIDDVLLTALVRAFQHWTHADALLVELEKHGREELFADVELSRTVGWFTSAFPIVLKLPQSNTTSGDDLQQNAPETDALREGSVPQNAPETGALDEEALPQNVSVAQGDKANAPEARGEGSQWQVRSAAEHAATGNEHNDEQPGTGDRHAAADVSVGPSGLAQSCSTIQGQRADALAPGYLHPAPPARNPAPGDLHSTPPARNPASGDLHSAPEARGEGSQWQVRSAAEHAATGNQPTDEQPGTGDRHAATDVSVGPSGLAQSFSTIQGQRANALAPGYHHSAPPARNPASGDLHSTPPARNPASGDLHSAPPARNPALGDLHSALPARNPASGDLHSTPLARSGANPLGDALKSTKEQLRRIPRGGLGYGLLRYLCRDEEIAREMKLLPQPEISFNYLGQLDQMFQSSGLFRPAREATGAGRDAKAQRGNLLEVNASISGGHLQAEWTYSAEIHDRATIERLAHDFLAELQDLIAHCLATKTGAHTPSDFPLAHLSQTQLDELLATRADVTDLFHLSPMQQGMLFHILYAANTDVYLGQFSCALQGDIDPDLLGISWQQTLNNHEVLRASFVWENLDEPLQLIHESVGVPLERDDWRDLRANEQAERWEAFLVQERQRGFDLSTPPLMRLALVRLGRDSYRFAWTHHHLLLDGWSGALVLREVFNTYEALRRDEQVRVEPRRPFRDYIAWLDQQDLSKAETFWRENLKGFTAPTPLVIDHASVETNSQALGESKLQLSKQTTGHLQSLARRHGLTLNTILAGAWALLLNRYSQEESVVFGATVAGRPPSLPGVETMVGLFINTLPVRVHIDEDAELLAWLKVLQAEQVELREYEYSPLVEVQRWSEVGRGRPLFESLLVFENYPLDAAALKENLRSPRGA